MTILDFPDSMESLYMFCRSVDQIPQQLFIKHGEYCIVEIDVEKPLQKVKSFFEEHDIGKAFDVQLDERNYGTNIVIQPNYNQLAI